MSAKVLKDAAVSSVLWRRPAPAAPVRESEPEPDTSFQDHAELMQLRARVAELEAAVETKSRQSYSTGVKAGEELAREKLEAGVKAKVEQLSATIGELAATRGETIRRAEGDIVRLSIEIARRVLHRELAVDGSALEALIKAALEKLQSQEVYRVRVHPDRELAVRSCLDRTGRGQAITVVGDPVQPQGGAVFEISRGALDASVETQLAEIEHGLISQLEARI